MIQMPSNVDMSVVCLSAAVALKVEEATNTETTERRGVTMQH